MIGDPQKWEYKTNLNNETTRPTTGMSQNQILIQSLTPYMNRWSIKGMFLKNHILN